MTDLSQALAQLERTLGDVRFRMGGEERDELSARRDRLRWEISNLRARLDALDAPLLAVFSGGTGAGKSTLINTLTDAVVTTATAKRPTTHSPTLIAHPDDVERLGPDRLLGAFHWAPAASTDPEARQAAPVLRVATSERLPGGLALVDTPDVDSLVVEHGPLADQLLDAADLWVWVVTGQTYADEAGMAYLRRAARRDTALIVVLNQVHPDDAREIREDLLDKLAREGLQRPELHVVPRTRVADQRLPAAEVADFTTRLWSAAAPDQRSELRRRTIDGAVADLPHELEALVAGIRSDLEAAATLTDAAEAAYAAVSPQLDGRLEGGLQIRTEVLQRWRDLLGSGRVLERVESVSARVRGVARDLLASAPNGEPAEAREVQAEVTTALTDTVVELLDGAALDAAHAWEHHPEGHRLLLERPELRRASDSTRQDVEAEIAGWQSRLRDLVATTGARRRMRSRWVASGANAAIITSLLAVFASTGGLTGAEALLAGGGGAASHALLAKLLGSKNLAWLMEEISDDLHARVSALADVQAARYRAAVDTVSPDPELLERLREELDRVATAGRA